MSLEWQRLVDQYKSKLEFGLWNAEESLELAHEIYVLLNKWSKIINLVGHLDEESFFRDHYLDSYLSFEAFTRSGLPFSLQQPSFKLIDVGCGSGVFGLFFWYFLNHSAQLHLVDRDRKKINFCRELTRNLGFSQQITCVQADGIPYISQFISESTLVISRATFGIASFFEKIKEYHGDMCFMYIGGQENNLKIEGVQTLSYGKEIWNSERVLYVKSASE